MNINAPGLRQMNVLLSSFWVCPTCLHVDETSRGCSEGLGHFIKSGVNKESKEKERIGKYKNF